MRLCLSPLAQIADVRMFLTLFFFFPHHLKYLFWVPEDSMEESFDEDAYYEKLGTRPALDAEALGGSYRRMVELFYLCTEEDPEKRPSASQIVQALESNSLLEKAPREVIVID